MFGFSVGMDLSQSPRRLMRGVWPVFFVFFWGVANSKRHTDSKKCVQQLKVLTCWPWLSMIYIWLEYVRHEKQFLRGFLASRTQVSNCDGSRPLVTSVEQRFSVLGSDCWWTGKVVCATCIGCGMGPLESWRKLGGSHVCLRDGGKL